MDAANIDLKAFEEDFYFKLTGAHLQPVLDTIEYACNETDCWVELTNLIIPDANDSSDEIRRMCEWVDQKVGRDVPIHFTAFHPDFRMRDRERTDPATLVRAYEIAKEVGLHHVYVGNVHDVSRQSTYCNGCGELVIQRDWHQLGVYQLDGSACRHCGQKLPGRFESAPGDWGAKRQRVRIESAEADVVQIQSSPKQHVPSDSVGRKITSYPSSSPGPTDATADSRQGTMAMPETGLTELDERQQETILRAAGAMLHAAVVQQDPSTQIGLLGELAELPIEGVFVTVKRGETLRGCCGSQGATMQLGKAMAEAAARTARDPRMPPVSGDELPFLELSVSLLGPLRPIPAEGADREAAVQVGTHGLRIQCGSSGGLLLPQVATEQGWNAAQFLDAVCRKAGLPAGSWQRQDAQLMLFDGVCFGMPFPVDTIDPDAMSVAGELISRQDLNGYLQWIGHNLQAMVLGATPMYYATGVSDGEVLGIVLSVRHKDRGEQQWLQLSIRDPMPLQSTLYRMSELAGRWLGRDVSAGQIEFDLSLLGDCVHHGPIQNDSGSQAAQEAQGDVRGIDVGQRAIVVSDGRRWAVQFGGGSGAGSLVEDALSMEPFRGGEQLYSMRCQSSADQMAVSIGPRGDARPTVRAAAVAGSFYPAEDSAREDEVDRLLDGLGACVKRPAFAIMVPHAGLRFSGRIAADVWRRIKVPERTLIIGPKHTADGVDWAVAPHPRWQLSAAVSVEGDVETANDLAMAVPGFELDAAAHAREHGIEVQLPLLHRLCPGTRLSAVAMHGGGIRHFRRAAQALAQWMLSHENPPLLVVSSDMNHFAEDAENRRRDRLALDALATGDGERLLRICQHDNISMCGRIPAAIVLMVMEEMGLQIPAEEIGYATSADYGGDAMRVVGYAGVIWPSPTE